MSRHGPKEIERCKCIASKMTIANPAEGSLAAPTGSAVWFHAGWERAWLEVDVCPRMRRCLRGWLRALDRLKRDRTESPNAPRSATEGRP